ncbi:MAG: hypothetical protein JNM56_27465 [Planctomycetia bacterium]|nr:hypothetical protein [Planctomycetia bacterium]
MCIRTWLRFLVGERQAILELAADRQAIYVGALFVLSAGLAREYDAADLLHEPWHLLLPFAASIGASFILFCVTYGSAKLKGAPGPGFWSAYRAFLGLFWLTAPLAWLYALPYERFLTPLGATQANLWTLGLVSVWRVYLMMRVVGVLMNYRAGAIFLVMVVADAEAFLALHFLPRPIIPLMANIWMTESQILLAEVGDALKVITFLSLPVWAIGALVATLICQPAWQTGPVVEEAARGGLRRLALASVAFWLALLPFTQPEQILRRQVERLLQAGRITDGLALMSAHQPADFPPHWDPIPQEGYFQISARTLQVFEEIERSPPAPWVKALFEEKRASRRD